MDICVAMYGHVRENVYRHGHEHVCRHVNGHVRVDTCVEMHLDTCANNPAVLRLASIILSINNNIMII